MPTESVSLEYTANIGKLQAELAKLPGISAKEARGMVKSLDSELKKATKAARASARASQESFEKLGQTFEGTKRVADAFGGTAGSVAGSVEHMGKSVLALTGALGPAGAGILAATIAVGGFAAGAVAAALNASDLAAELKKAGRTPVITKAQLMEVDQLDAAVGELTSRSKEFVVAFGAEFAPAVTTVVVLMADLVDVGRGAIDVFTDLGDSTETFRRSASAVISLGLSEVLRSVWYETEEYADKASAAALAANEFKKQSDALAASLKDQEKAIKDAQMAMVLEEEAKAAHEAARAQSRLEEKMQRTQARREEAAREAQRLAQETARSEEKAAREAAAAIAKAEKESADLRQSIHTEMLARMLDREREKEAEQQAMIAERIAAEQRYAEYLAEQQESIQDSVLMSLDAIGSGLEVMFQRQEDAAREALDGITNELEALKDRRMEIIQELSVETDKAKRHELMLEKQTVEGSIRARRKQQNAEREALQKAFQRQKALALVQIAIATAVAIMQSVAQLGPIAGAVAGVAIGITGGIQAAVVASQKPPVFHDGGMARMAPGPDEQPATLRRGEAVLNQRATEELGRDGVDALNSGQSSAGSGMYVVNLDGRAIAKGVASRVRDEVGSYLAELGGAFPGYAPVYGS